MCIIMDTAQKSLIIMLCLEKTHQFLATSLFFYLLQKNQT